MLSLKQVSVLLFFVMFIYSGFNKITGFSKKVEVLQKKTGLSYQLNQLGMIGVIILELIGSLLIIAYTFDKTLVSKQLVKLTKGLFLLFLVVVTLLYHPPGKKKMIPFLSNLTIFSGLLYMFSDS